MIQFIANTIIKITSGISFLYDRILAACYKSAMAECGKGVMLRPNSSIYKGLHNIHLADDVRIARYATIYSTEAQVFIGPKVGIAPYLKIITGNHRIDQVGHFMFDGNGGKLPENDKDVVIEGDSWIGVNVTILSGVKIGRGSVIAAGAVINKSMPPYSIIGGVPAKVLKYRFSIDEALEHEQALYPEDLRYTREQLLDSRKQ